RDCYVHAIKARYRFFSYGDSSLLIFENDKEYRVP
ncbi:MAG: S-adenosylmethionine:tRNA ribosyltransferase-isomerase, partial [Silvanigrellaceae bacterium]|nr:S-adenosylmethionine:tRNA ribosyltransferase-isomerase [Silvanigrellaceae bacterium]